MTEQPQPVVIIRPDANWSTTLAEMVGSVLSILVAAVVLMIGAPVALPGFTPDYVRCVAIVLVVRTVLPGTTGLGWSFTKSTWKRQANR